MVCFHRVKLGMRVFLSVCQEADVAATTRSPTMPMEPSARITVTSGMGAFVFHDLSLVFLAITFIVLPYSSFITHTFTFILKTASVVEATGSALTMTVPTLMCVQPAVYGVTVLTVRRHVKTCISSVPVMFASVKDVYVQRDT